MKPHRIMNTFLFSVLAHSLSTDIRQAASQSRTLGFDAIEFPVAHMPGELSSTGFRELRHLIAAQRLELQALHLTLPGKGFMPDTAVRGRTSVDIDRALDLAEQAMQVCRQSGAKQLVIDVGLLPRGRVTPPRKRITSQLAGALILPDTAVQEVEVDAVPLDTQAIASVDAAMIELGNRADRAGVMICLTTSLSPIVSLADALARVDCPWFFASIDTAAVIREGTQFSDAFNMFTPRKIAHVRAQDVVRGDAGLTRPTIIGRGDVPWRELLSLLREADYLGSILIETTDLPDRTAAARAGLTQLRAIAAT